MVKDPSKPKAPRCTWSDADDAIMVTTLLWGKENSYQTDSGWKPQVWPFVQTALTNSAGAPKMAPKCLDHWTTLKKEFNQVRTLRGLSGFGWDDGLKMVTAADDMWDRYIEFNAWASKWRKTPRFPLYDDILKLVDGIVATGEGAFHAGTSQISTQTTAASQSSTLDDNDNDDLTQPSNSSNPATSQVPFTPRTPANRAPVFDDANPSSPPVPSSSRKRAASLSPQKPNNGRRNRRRNADAASDMASALRDVAGALKVTGSPEIRKRAIEILEDDDKFSDNDCVDAMALFEKNIAIAQTYIGSKNKERRTAYLQRHLDSVFG
ncbi:hypothetical protein C8F01DRAFT_1145629 [Mycena amicta]|nr:hypothetical protein C8F01DRAFT_1145629 [Mycena amicta]